MDKILAGGSLEAALARYREAKEKEKDAFTFGERELDVLGHRLLGRKKIREALEIFKLNAEAYPESSSVLTSLADAYLALGSRDLAVQNYKKAVQLNANNTGAIEMLRSLAGS